MMDLSPENPFGDLMSKAVKLKGHQQAQLRTRFDAWPQYFQHSMFMQESVTSLRDKSFSERIEAAESMKTTGNNHFAGDVCDQAVAEYEKALAIFTYAENTDPGWKKKGIEDKDIRVVTYSCEDADDQKRLDALKIACWLNIAVCKFKLKEYPVSVQACDDVLGLDSSNVKALYRRALALITPLSSGALEFERALKDLELAYSIDPDNRDVRKMYRDLREQKVKQKQLDQATFSGMFNRGQVYDGETTTNDNAVGEEDEKDKEKKFMKEVEEAENLARMCEDKGHREYANEIRGKVEQAKEARKSRLKEVDFFHPTPQMIEDAKKQGIDLSDPQVQRMLHELQEEERKKKGNPPTAQPDRQDTATSDAVEAVLKSMNSTQIAEMLGREGIDYHSIIDRDQFMETARAVIATKLASNGKAGPSNSYMRTICIIAVVWTLLRLYASGGLSVLIRAVRNLMFGNAALEDAIQTNQEDVNFLGN